MGLFRGRNFTVVSSSPERLDRGTGAIGWKPVPSRVPGPGARMNWKIYSKVLIYKLIAKRTGGAFDVGGFGP